MHCEIAAELIEAMKRELGLTTPNDLEHEELFRVFDRALEYPPDDAAMA